MKTGFVFDLDGTLVDSIPGIARGLNLALKAAGYPEHSEEAVRKMVGQGSRVLCRSALRPYFDNEPPTEAFDAVYQGFMREYLHTWQDGTVPYAGMHDMLLSLAERGYSLGVLSNKPHEVTVPLVHHVFPDVPFRTVMGHSDQFPRKPDPSALLHIASEWGVQPQQLCMVGDSVHDANTACNAGTGLVLVGWGYCTRTNLEAFLVPICDAVTSLGETLSSL